MPAEEKTPEITADPVRDVERSPAGAPPDGEQPAAAGGTGSRSVSSAPAATAPSTGGSSDGESPYDFVIDLNSDNTHASVVHMVGRSRRVLELGPASGYMSQILRDRDCEVVGIELDPQLAVQAAEVCERVIVGDLDTLDLDAELGDDRFDVIVAADVLEHLRDPLAALRRLRRFLKSEGYFVVSLPNVAHASVRLALLQGHFQYRELGLMDRTHLRFFTHDTITQLFDEAELAIVEVHRQEAPIEVDDAPFDRDAVSEDLIKELESDPDARTYQFVIKAVGLEFPGLREVQRRLHEQAFALARLERELLMASPQRQQLEGQLAELEHALAEISAREGEVRAALIDSHDLALRRDEELRQVGERLEDEEKRLAELWQAHDEAKKIIRAREDEVESLRRENNVLRVRIGRIADSLPVRMWHLLSGMPPLRWVRGRRVAAYTAEVQHLQAKDE